MLNWQRKDLIKTFVVLSFRYADCKSEDYRDKKSSMTNLYRKNLHKLLNIRRSIIHY